MDDLVVTDNRPGAQVSGTDSIEPDITKSLVDKRTALMKRIKDLEARVNRIDEEYRAKRDELQARKRPLEEALFHVEALLRIDGSQNPAESASSGQLSGGLNARNLSVTEAAFAILQQAHEPLHYREITKILQEKGIHVPGKNPAATLLSRMSRDRRFKRGSKRGLYALAGWHGTSPSRNAGKKRKSGRMHKRIKKVGVTK